MRKAYELSFANAFSFCGTSSPPTFLSVDDISFLRPVRVGNMLKLHSQVIYATENACQVKLNIEVCDLQKRDGINHISNVFHFTFSKGTTGPPLKQLIPQTYEEAMDYIDGKRRLENCIQEAKQANSALLHLF